MKHLKVIGLDPGPGDSAVVVWNGDTVEVTRMGPNSDIMGYLRTWRGGGVPLAIEKIASYGMAVGAEVFETCVWTGRFMEAYGGATRITRGEVKMHLCHTMKAKDTNVRQAILDRFGGKDKAIGTKSSPGPFRGVTSHLWSALAVAIVFHDQLNSTASAA